MSKTLTPFFFAVAGVFAKFLDADIWSLIAALSFWQCIVFWASDLQLIPTVVRYQL